MCSVQICGDSTIQHRFLTDMDLRLKKSTKSWKISIKVKNSLKLHSGFLQIATADFCGSTVHTHVGIAITWFKKGMFSSVKINTIQFLLPKNAFNAIPQAKQAVLVHVTRIAVDTTQTSICSKSNIEALENGVKNLQS